MAPETTGQSPSGAAPSLEGRIFELVSSSASAVAATPTRFVYHERDGIVWGEYDGDTVALGRVHGVRRRDTLELAFVHRRVDGSTVRGEATSRIERDGDRLRLVESFVAPDGTAATSECVEVPPQETASRD